MRYRAILIDADDTLFDFVSAERNAITGVLRQLGVTDPAAPDAYNRINAACWTDFENGTITQARLKVRRFEELLLRYGLDSLDAAEVSGRYEGELAKQGLLIEGALDTVRRITMERPVAIVTNGIARVQRGRMALSPLKDLVSALIISEEVGCAKPNPRMIETALAALGGIDPRDALMAGDSLNSDMRCALNAGTDSCWYNPDRLSRPADIAITHEIRDIRELADIALS